VPNPYQEFDTKLDGIPHELALKYIKSMTKTQVNGDAETLNSFNLETIQI
jgi:hypothetical protein